MKTVRVVIFAKAPLAGLAKTRLSCALGTAGAASLARKLLNHCVAEAMAADIGPVELCVSPSARHPVWRELAIPSAVTWSEQGEGDLGERLARAAQRVIAQREAVLLIGTDCPGLTADRLQVAAASLNQHDACLHPVSDGGYALLGLSEYLPSVFMNMPWSTSAVAELTRRRIQVAGWTLKVLELLHDIDEPQDLQWLPAGWLPCTGQSVSKTPGG
ncbi:MAG TPA: TIGR04282 family arsenosugar biosynthesis glycosyltransferase [Thiolinea sp.]|nr:TIGR04282 family arsenosugar biosynthesis glycosyltransferase [Thiolinea sp.]